LRGDFCGVDASFCERVAIAGLLAGVAVESRGGLTAAFPCDD
jgi:hypothetical protein